VNDISFGFRKRVITRRIPVLTSSDRPPYAVNASDVDDIPNKSIIGPVFSLLRLRAKLLTLFIFSLAAMLLFERTYAFVTRVDDERQSPDLSLSM